MLNNAREVNHAPHFRYAIIGKGAPFRGFQEGVHAKLVIGRAAFNPLESENVERGIFSVHAMDATAVEESSRNKRGRSVSAERDKLA